MYSTDIIKSCRNITKFYVYIYIYRCNINNIYILCIYYIFHR